MALLYISSNLQKIGEGGKYRESLIDFAMEYRIYKPCNG